MSKLILLLDTSVTFQLMPFNSLLTMYKMLGEAAHYCKQGAAAENGITAMGM